MFYFFNLLGKKFSTVDKSWRQAISAAKAKPKAIEFCDNAKLLEKFKESEILLDQVQKGLSDYLETKRYIFLFQVLNSQMVFNGNIMKIGFCSLLLSFQRRVVEHSVGEQGRQACPATPQEVLRRHRQGQVPLRPSNRPHHLARRFISSIIAFC